MPTAPSAPRPAPSSSCVGATSPTPPPVPTPRRNPPSFGYGYPPVIVSSPGGGTIGSSGYNYRVSDPPSQSRSGQTVTQQKPTTPGQGATRPSSSTGATGSGPSYSSGNGSSSGS